MLDAVFHRSVSFTAKLLFFDEAGKYPSIISHFPRKKSFPNAVVAQLNDRVGTYIDTKSNNLIEKRLSILRKLRIFVVQLYF